MNSSSIDNRITLLAPVPQQLDEQWASDTLARILAEAPPERSRWVARHRTAAVAVGGVLALTAGVGVAAATGVLDPITTNVKQALLDFAAEPNTTGNDVGTIHDPQLGAQFELSNGDIFAFWFATTSGGTVCDAFSDPAWDGVSAPVISEYGCPMRMPHPTEPDRLVPLERPDQLGGLLMADNGDPILYGVSPFPGAAEVEVRGLGVDLVLPLRADSLGYGTVLPRTPMANSVELTFLDSDGQPLGTKTLVSAVG